MFAWKVCRLPCQLIGLKDLAKKQVIASYLLGLRKPNV